MDREAVAKLLFEIDQRITYGHVKTPWVDRRAGIVGRHFYKIAEMVVADHTVSAKQEVGR